MRMEVRWVGIKIPAQPALLGSDPQCLADQQSLPFSRDLEEDLALRVTTDQIRPPAQE